MGIKLLKIQTKNPLQLIYKQPMLGRPRPKYKNSFHSNVFIENGKLEIIPPAVRPIFERVKVKGGGDWYFSVRVMPKPDDMVSLTKESLRDFDYIHTEFVKTYENYEFKDFLKMIHFRFCFSLKIRKYKHEIVHDEPWDEQNYIFHTFKSKGLTSEEARELADKIEEDWEFYKLSKNNYIARLLLPNEQAVIPRAFVDDCDGNWNFLFFENEQNQIVRVDYQTS